MDNRWMIPAGREWDGTAQTLTPEGDTNDQGCVAIRRHDDGRVSVADTKQDRSSQTPLTFTAKEWADLEAAIRAGTI